MPAPKPKKREEEKEDWLVTYADAITLLMAFFVMLLTFAEYDIPALEDAAAAIREEVGGRQETSPIIELQIAVQDIADEFVADQVVQVSKDKKGLVIELASNAFYQPGSDQIRPEAVPLLQKIAQTIAAPRYDFYRINVEGHTDDDPISTERFPSNWELSTARATQVVRFLINEGFVPTRLMATGFAETRPKVPNRDDAGQAIKANQAINRRVNVRVTPMNEQERTEFRTFGERLMIDDLSDDEFEQMIDETQSQTQAPQEPTEEPQSGLNEQSVQQFQQGLQDQ